MSNKIDVVLVTYNRLGLLKECIKALLSQKGYIEKIYIVNNNSTDGTTVFLEKVKSDRIVVENLKQNIGGAAGFEYGINSAIKNGSGRYIWIMDDDTIPSETAAQELVNGAKNLNDEFGFLCSNVRWTDGSATNVPVTVSRWSEQIENGLVNVKSATFVSAFVTRENVLKLGLPIGKMEIWGDDTEYTTRMSSYKPSYFVIKSVVIHKTKYNLMNDSLKNIEQSRIIRYKKMYRNLIYIERKFGSKRRILKMLILNSWNALTVLKAKDNRLRRSWAAISGSWDGIFFNPKIKKAEQ